jgi:hypothetical protein
MVMMQEVTHAAPSKQVLKGSELIVPAASTVEADAKLLLAAHDTNGDAVQLALVLCAYLHSLLLLSCLVSILW